MKFYDYILVLNLNKPPVKQAKEYKMNLYDFNN